MAERIRRNNRRREVDLTARGLVDLLTGTRVARENSDFPDLDEARARVDELRHTMCFDELRAAAIDEAVALANIICSIPPPDQEEDLEQ